MWWNGEMRSAGNRGDWLGDRVTEAVPFWDNSATDVITGIKCTSAPASYWSMFDHFRLHFFGGSKPSSGISDITDYRQPAVTAYDLQGRKVSSAVNRHPALKNGIYIIGGKKVVVRN